MSSDDDSDDEVEEIDSEDSTESKTRSLCYCLCEFVIHIDDEMLSASPAPTGRGLDMDSSSESCQPKSEVMTTYQSLAENSIILMSLVLELCHKKEKCREVQIKRAAAKK